MSAHGAGSSAAAFGAPPSPECRSSPGLPRSSAAASALRGEEREAGGGGPSRAPSPQPTRLLLTVPHPVPFPSPLSLSPVCRAPPGRCRRIREGQGSGVLCSGASARVRLESCCIWGNAMANVKIEAGADSTMKACECVPSLVGGTAAPPPFIFIRPLCSGAPPPSRPSSLLPAPD